MDKGRTKKSFNFIMILLLFSLMVFIVFLVINNRENPISEVIDIINKDGVFVEGHNGVYVSSESLNGEYQIMSGCTLNRIDNVVVIMDDDYYKYRSSCLGTFVKGTGKTKDLNIRYSEENKTYIFDLDKKRYVKDYIIDHIDITNNVLLKRNEINLENYDFIIKETEFEGNYYDILKRPVRDLDVVLDLHKNQYNLGYDLKLSVRKDAKLVYSFNAPSPEYLPKFYLYGSSFAALEVYNNYNMASNKYSYNLKMLNSEKGLLYNFRNDLPIIINGVKLGVPLTYDEAQKQDEYSSIFITFDRSRKRFIVLIGKDKKMCVKEPNPNDKDEILYYEFSIKFNYLSGGFDKPYFERVGYASEGCNHVDKIIGR